MTNRFQRSGSAAVYEVSETKNACVVRLDMPGCPDSDLIYWIEGINVHFFADEQTMPESDHAARKYGGTMVFNPETYNVKDAVVKLLNGVLWINVPKIPGTNANINVIEQMIYY